MKSKALNVLKFLIGWPISLIALFFIYQRIAPQAPKLLEQAATANPWLLFYGLTGFVLFYFLRGYIWYRFLRELGHAISFKEATYLWAISEVKRYIPGNVWSFLGRTVLFQEKGVTKKDIARGFLIEAELFILGSMIISLLGLPFVQAHFGLSTLWSQIIILCVTLITIIYACSDHLLRFIPDKLHKVATFFLPHFSVGTNMILIGVSTVALFFFGLATYLLTAAYTPIDPNLAIPLSGFSVLAFLLGYLSILTPAGLGVREGVMIAGLSKLAGITTSIAAFAAIFTRIILILAELIFIGLIVVWRNVNQPWLSKGERWIAEHKQVSVVSFLIGIYCLYFIPITFLRYDNYYTGRFDLGNMAQTVWNTIHGRIFLFTNPDSTETISRLAFHADFMLVLLAPFYFIWENPKMLLLIQTVILALGAVFVYLIAKDLLKNRNLGVIFAFVYLLNPALQRTNLYDFHAVTLATTFFLGTYYFFQKRNYLWFGIFAILAALCKEQLWVIVALFGVFICIQQKKWLLGSIVTFASLAMFYLLVWHAIPSQLGEKHFALSFYAELGDSPTEVVSTVIFSPWKLWDIIVQPEKITYLKQLFAPLGFLSLLGPIWLLFAIPDLLINLVSSNANFHQLYYQYTATITPFLFIAAIYGARFIQRCCHPERSKRVEGSHTNQASLLQKILGLHFVSLRMTTLNAILILYLLGTSLYTAYAYGPLPGAIEENIAMINPKADRAFIEEYIANIPVEYRVAASNNIAANLSHREHIYVLPQGVDQADMIIFLLTTSYTNDRENKLIESLKKDPRLSLKVNRPPFVVFEKNK